MYGDLDSVICLQDWTISRWVKMVGKFQICNKSWNTLRPRLSYLSPRQEQCLDGLRSLETLYYVIKLTSCDSGFKAYCILHSPTTLKCLITLMAVDLRMLYSTLVRVWLGATTIDSPVCIPKGSTFSMLHTYISIIRFNIYRCCNTEIRVHQENQGKQNMKK